MTIILDPMDAALIVNALTTHYARHGCTPAPRAQRLIDAIRDGVQEDARRMNSATPEQIAKAMESMPTDALEFGVRFEALGHDPEKEGPE